MSSPDTQDTRRKLLEANIKSGSGWLWSVAGFSLLNTIVLRAGSEYTFCVGLMFTQVSDYGSMQYAKEAGAAANPWVTVAALVFDALMIGGAALVARACDRRCGWIVIAGLLIYALDTAFFALSGLSIGLLIHGLTLWYGFKAFRSIGQLKRLPLPEPVAAPAPSVPPALPDAPSLLPARPPVPAQLVAVAAPRASPRPAAEAFVPPTLPSSLREPAPRRVIEPRTEARIEESDEPTPGSALTRSYTGWPALIVALVVLGAVVAGVIYVCQDADQTVARFR